MGILDSLVPSESAFVGIKEDEMIGLPQGAHVVILVRVALMEVEYEEKLPFLVNYHLVHFIRCSDELVLGDHGLELNFSRVHYFIEFTELSVSQVCIVHKIPLPSAVIITVSIALTREVDPFWMSKLVTHEVEICLTTQALRNEPDHLVEGHSSRDAKIGLKQATHASVDVCIEQPHRLGLVTDDGLVMALCVADNLLPPSSISQTMRNMAHIPVLIRRAIKELDPHIRHKHTQPIIKSHTAILEFPAERGHTRNILSNSDCIWINLPDQSVCEHQVDDSVQVSVETEVLGVVAREGGADTVVLV
jgi:hypothetical protein